MDQNFLSKKGTFMEQFKSKPIAAALIVKQNKASYLSELKTVKKALCQKWTQKP